MPTTHTPQEMLDAARSGDGAAWGNLLDHYRPYLTLLADIQIGRRLRGKADPGDLVQETLLQAHQDFPAFRGTTEDQFTAWLREILACRLARLMRHYLGTQKRDVKLERDLCTEFDQSSRRLDECLASPGSSPSAGAARREQAVRLAAALAQLTPEHREVLILRHVEALSFPEVGDRMGRSADAATKLWARAVRRLREVFGDDDESGRG